MKGASATQHTSCTSMQLARRILVIHHSVNFISTGQSMLKYTRPLTSLNVSKYLCKLARLSEIASYLASWMHDINMDGTPEESIENVAQTLGLEDTPVKGCGLKLFLGNSPVYIPLSTENQKHVIVCSLLILASYETGIEPKKSFGEHANSQVPRRP